MFFTQCRKGGGEIQQLQLASPRLNTDPRLITAYNLFSENENGIMLVHKTTRAGATTGMAAESINRSEQFLILVPTNKIATKTIVRDAVKYSDIKNAKVIHVPSNHNCIKNAEMCEEYPALKSLPFLPLPEKCNNCDDYDVCPITEIIRKPTSHGFAMTYHKMVALILSSMMSSGKEPSMSEEILDIIANTKNIILDEIHEIQYGKKTTTVAYDSRKPDQLHGYDVTKYIPLSQDYVNLWGMIVQFQAMRSSFDIHYAIHEIKGAAEADNYWDKHISKTIDNDFSDIRINKGSDITKVVIGIYQDIIEITKRKEEYKLDIKDILNLIDMLNIILSDRIVIHAERRDGYTVVLLSSVDMIHNKLLKSFTLHIQKKAKRILLTSATICSYDYSNMFKQETTPKNVTFGLGGDPMNTNAKMHILSDKNKIYAHGKSSYYTKKDEILHNIIHILESYGDEKCIIISLNKKSSIEIEKDLKALKHPHSVTYYKAPNMMGVSSNARVMIAIGAAQKPRNSFDAITQTRKDSDIILEESMHCDTWQAWSRVKDPKGLKDSVVFAFGITDEMCMNCVSWGFNRQIEINHTSNNFIADRKSTLVTTDCQCITIPNVTKCDNFLNMCLIASKNTQCNNLVPKSAPSPLLYNIIGDLGQYRVQYINNVDKNRFIRDFIFNRYDVHAQQKVSVGSWFKSESEFNDDLIKSHFNGSKTIGSYTLRPGNVVKWICFDIDAHYKEETPQEEIIKKELEADTNVDKLCNVLSSSNIPFIVEASGSSHSYHIWLFLKDVEAVKAKSFGDSIIKSLGIDCEVFPKQTKITRKGYGNLVKAPLGTHQKHGGLSKIKIDGEWVRDFESIDIGIIDISDYVIPEKPKRKSRTKTNHTHLTSIPAITGVRPCIQNALLMSLTGTHGHAMRIAIVREFYNFGMTDVEKLANLFKNQADFDFDTSKYQVESIIKDQYSIWSKETLNERCSTFIDCEKCENVVCKGW